MAIRAMDLRGKRFGYLTVIEYTGRSSNCRALWLVECDCGNRVVRQSQTLRSRHRLETKSCGCKHGEKVSRGHDGHMMTGSRPWRIWQLMKQRCRDQKHKDFKNYGERGIDMLDRWFNSFRAFWNDMSDGYSDDLTIDRIDNMKGYSKANCRWATLIEQGRNQRTNILIDTPWGRMTVAEGAERANLGYQTLYRRHRRGDEGEHLFRPVA